MNVRTSFNRAVAMFVTGVMFWNPLLTPIVQAAGVRPVGGSSTTVTTTVDGASLVNIAPPSKKNLSHNTSASAIVASAAAAATSIAVQLGTTHKVNWSQVFKVTLVAAITAGILEGVEVNGQSINQLAGISPTPAVNGVPQAASRGIEFSWRQVAGVVTRGVVNAGVSHLITGADFEDAFINSVVGDYAALGATSIGHLWSSEGTNPNAFLQTASHALLGGVAAELRGGDFAAGALGGAVESILDNVVSSAGLKINKNDRFERSLYLAGSMLSAGFVAEALGKDSVTAAQAAQNAAENNFLTAKQLVEVDEALQACEAMANPDICKVQVVETARNLSRKQDFALAVAKIKCFVGLCSTLKDLNARIAEGNDPQSVSKLLTVSAEVKLTHYAEVKLTHPE